MIIIFSFLFIFYVFTMLLAFLSYILWYILCTNVTLAVALSQRKCEIIALHIKSIDPNFCLHGRYKLASHPVNNTWHTTPQSPTQDWDPLPDNNDPAPDN